MGRNLWTKGLDLDQRQHTRLRRRHWRLLAAAEIRDRAEGLRRGRRYHDRQVALAAPAIDVELVGVIALGDADADQEVDVGGGRRSAARADDVDKAGGVGNIGLLQLQDRRRTRLGRGRLRGGDEVDGGPIVTERIDDAGRYGGTVGGGDRVDGNSLRPSSPRYPAPR